MPKIPEMVIFDRPRPVYIPVDKYLRGKSEKVDYIRRFSPEIVATGRKWIEYTFGPYNVFLDLVFLVLGFGIGLLFCFWMLGF